MNQGHCESRRQRATGRPGTLPHAQPVFETVPQATQTVSDIIAAGIVPAALEMMDNLMIQAVEAAFHFGFPTDAGAVLIIELDGLAAGLDPQTAKDKIGMVVEGMYTCVSALQLGQKAEVSVPITQAVCSILYEGLDPRSAVKSLLQRAIKEEHL